MLNVAKLNGILDTLDDISEALYFVIEELYEVIDSSEIKKVEEKDYEKITARQGAVNPRSGK